MCGIVFAARPLRDFTDIKDYEDINIRHREASTARGSFRSIDVVDLGDNVST